MRWLIIMLLMVQSSFATTFVMFGNGFTGTVDTAFLDGEAAALTLTNSLPSDEMYLIWGTNSNGFGEPVAINKTQAWWVGPDNVATGDVFSVFGQNLNLGGGDTYLWCEEENEWLTNSVGNPYKADFVVPSTWTNGTKTIWAHNGKGREYGWADSLTLTISSKRVWGNTNTVAAFTSTAVNNALDTADDTDWSVVHFPVGTYDMDVSMFVAGGSLTRVKLLGDGVGSTIVRESATFSGTDGYLVYEEMDECEVEGIRFETGAGETGDFKLMFINNSNDTYFRDCTFSQFPNVGQSDIAGTKLVGDNFMANGASDIRFNDCEFHLAWILEFYNGDQLFWSNCTFRGMNATTKYVALKNNDGVSVVDSTAGHYDDNFSDAVSVGCLKSMGRFVTSNGDSGRVRNVYIGGNTTTNHTPHPLIDPLNVGEDILGEDHEVTYYSAVSSATSNTVAGAGLTGGNSQVIAVVSGTGVGQYRDVVGHSGTTITVDHNWNVEPDTSSIVVVGSFIKHWVVYDNHLDGDATDTSTSTAGVQPYWGSLGFIVDNNTITDQRDGIWFVSKGEATVSGSALVHSAPTMFGLIQNNTITGSQRVGIEFRNRDDVAGTHRATYYSTFSNLIRSNKVDSADGTAIVLDIISDNFANNFYLFADNAVTNATTASSIDAVITNDVWIGNTTNGVSWSP